MLLHSYRRFWAAPLRSQYRWLVTEAEAEVTPPKEPRKRRKRGEGEKSEMKVSKEIQTYFNMSPLLHMLPLSALRKRNKAPDSFYLAHEDSAEKIAQALVKDLDKNQTLVEANPGFGYLTQHLIGTPCNNLMLYEPSKTLHSRLQVSFLESPMNLKLIAPFQGYH